MKRRKYHIILSRILLICFIAGQYMVYAHQHNTAGSSGKICVATKNQTQQTLTEKCRLCDVMHHNVMVMGGQTYFAPVAVIGHVYKSCDYNFTSLQLILSGGRAPPQA